MLTMLQAVQWIWPVVILVGLPFSPESPYWLIRQGRREDARKSLMALTSKKHRPDIDQILLGIEHTDLLEQELNTSTSYMDCFKTINIVRTEISVMVYLIQVIGGNPLIAYANYFFEQAGLATSDAFNSEWPVSWSRMYHQVEAQNLLTFLNSGRGEYRPGLPWHSHLLAASVHGKENHVRHFQDYQTC
jgi:hypothetical protein